MEKIRLGIIGVGAQGGAYAGFLTGRGGMHAMPAAPQPEHRPGSSAAMGRPAGSTTLAMVSVLLAAVLSVGM